MKQSNMQTPAHVLLCTTVAVIVLLSANGCSNSANAPAVAAIPDNYIEFTLNGAGFNNRKITENLRPARTVSVTFQINTSEGAADTDTNRVTPDYLATTFRGRVLLPMDIDIALATRTC
jgi:hypothetical protein